MRPQFTHRQNTVGRHVPLGVDELGTTHHYDEKTSRIIAVRDGAIEHVERFDDAEDRDAVVTAWIDFVEDGPEGEKNDGRGWATRNYMTNHEFDDLEAGARTLSKLVGGSA